MLPSVTFYSKLSRQTKRLKKILICDDIPITLLLSLSKLIKFQEYSECNFYNGFIMNFAMSLEAITPKESKFCSYRPVPLAIYIVGVSCFHLI
jgi:hypothetical protein